jgi:hypothetical protein
MADEKVGVEQCEGARGGRKAVNPFKRKSVVDVFLLFSFSIFINTREHESHDHKRVFSTDHRRSLF